MAGGHGYTTDPFGISTAKHVYTDEEEKLAVPAENRKYIAMLKGKRKLNNGRPSFTNFCMSNPDARRMVVDYVADYLEKHSNIDIFSFPLADGYNNYCECENCRKMRPSDWLVILLNDMDAELTKRGLDTKIEFCVYVDCIWAPLTARFKNPDRFIMCYAPISRKYLKTMSGVPGKVAPYVYNKIVLPEEEDDYYAHLVEWKAAADIPVHVTEYHFWDCKYADPYNEWIAQYDYPYPERIKKETAEKGIAVEVNLSVFKKVAEDGISIMMIKAEEISETPYAKMIMLAKKAGCKLIFGTDAHGIEEYDKISAPFAAVHKVLEIKNEDIADVAK